MKKKINKQFYSNKLEKIQRLEAKSYQSMEKEEKYYRERTNYYKNHKDQIGKKIRMLEVYQKLWEDLEIQLLGQGFLNEEFWQMIHFSIIKYKEFMGQLQEADLDHKSQKNLDKRANKELWDLRQQEFVLIKNDIGYLNTHFNKMHEKIHKHAIIQRECIEKHICVMEAKVDQIEKEKEVYRNYFHEIQEDLGAKGKNISKQALVKYKMSIMEKLDYLERNSNLIELDLAR